MTEAKVHWRDPGGPSRKEIMDRLHTEGVDTVDKLVDKLLSFRKSHPPSEPREEAFLGGVLAGPGTRPKALKEIFHQPPQVPLYVDGVAIEPKDISQFDGRPLEFVIAKQPGGKPALHASTGTPLSDHIKATYTAAMLGSSSQPRIRPLRGLSAEFDPGQGPFNYGQVQMFQDIEYQSNWTWCAAGQQIPDLRQVSRDCTLWWCGDWND